MIGTPAMRTFLLNALALLCVSLPLWFSSTAAAQQQIPSKVEVAWNRFYDYHELIGI
jgi:hypothetical protein